MTAARKGCPLAPFECGHADAPPQAARCSFTPVLSTRPPGRFIGNCFNEPGASVEWHRGPAEVANATKWQCGRQPGILLHVQSRPGFGAGLPRGENLTCSWVIGDLTFQLVGSLHGRGPNVRASKAIID